MFGFRSYRRKWQSSEDATPKRLNGKKYGSMKTSVKPVSQTARDVDVGVLASGLA
jgi:hypothetical protein